MKPNLRRDLKILYVILILAGYLATGSFYYRLGSQPNPNWSTDPMAAPEATAVVVQFATTTVSGGMTYRTMDAERIGGLWFNPKADDMEGHAFTPINLPFIAWTFGPKE